MELRKELSTLTSLDLPATLIFDYPSVAEMTGALSAMLPGASAVPTAAKQRQAAAPEVAVTRRDPAQQTAVPLRRDLASHWLPQVGTPEPHPIRLAYLHVF